MHRQYIRERGSLSRRFLNLCWEDASLGIARKILFRRYTVSWLIESGRPYRPCRVSCQEVIKKSTSLYTSTTIDHAFLESNFWVGCVLEYKNCFWLHGIYYSCHEFENSLCVTSWTTSLIALQIRSLSTLSPKINVALFISIIFIKTE